MKKILSSKEMAHWDKYTIEEKGVPSLVLMERAALACVNKINELITKDDPIGIICGPGNNGGDGVAIARILHNQGYNVKLLVIGNPEKYSDQLQQEIKIAKGYDVPFVDKIDSIKDAILLIDALFGIGLSRDITGEYLEAITFINNSNARVLAVDIPSGYNSDTGSVLGAGVKADYTVTFAYIKKGLLLGECFLNKGKLIVSDVGIYVENDNKTTHLCIMIENKDIKKLIPETSRGDNKGSRGKVLVIAGSEEIYGACYMSAKAALSSGSGLVKIYTHQNNIASIQTSLPEAMYKGYDSYCEDDLDDLLSWADSVVIGPGLSISDTSEKIVSYVIRNAKTPVVIDADGINIVANNIDLLSRAKSYIFLTPHLKEMNRLCGKSISDILSNTEEISMDFCRQYNCSIIVKNYTSYICGPDMSFINITGNEGMATAGSGDVLAGILGSLLAQGIDYNYAPAIASYIHGRAGEKASLIKGKRQMLATDIIDNIEF